MAYGPGGVIFEEGSPGFDLYVIKTGVVEVRKRSEGHQKAKVVSFLSPGECVGEMSLITGLPRSATVRVPQKADVFRVPGLAFEGLLNRYAAIAVSLAKILAFRLEIANQLHVSESSAQKHLSGDLEYFDLLEVSQTLHHGRRTGVMAVVAPAVGGEAQLFFDGGHIRHARSGRLDGRDAVLCVFRRPLEGSFEFRTTDAYEGPLGETAIEESPMGLILEAVRQRDEIDALRTRLPPAGHIYHRRAASVPWIAPAARGAERDGRQPWQPTSAAELAMARSLHAEIGAGRTIGALVDAHPADELAVHEIVAALLAAGHIA